MYTAAVGPAASMRRTSTETTDWILKDVSMFDLREIVPATASVVALTDVEHVEDNLLMRFLPMEALAKCLAGPRLQQHEIPF